MSSSTISDPFMIQNRRRKETHIASNNAQHTHQPHTASHTTHTFPVSPPFTKQRNPACMLETFDQNEKWESEWDESKRQMGDDALHCRKHGATGWPGSNGESCLWWMSNCLCWGCWEFRMLLIYVYHSFSLLLVLEKISPYISDEDHRRRRCCNGPNSDFSFQQPSGTQSYQSQNSDHKYRCSKNCTHRI